MQADLAVAAPETLIDVAVAGQAEGKRAVGPAVPARRAQQFRGEEQTTVRARLSVQRPVAFRRSGGWKSAGRSYDRFVHRRFALVAAATAMLLVACGSDSPVRKAASVQRQRVPVVPALQAVPVPIVPIVSADRPHAKRAATTRRPAPVATGATGRIVIPSIGLDTATYEGIEPADINKGPSHWPGTARPGDKGNSTFGGHRVTYTRPFHDIDKIRRGDEVIFVNDFGRFTYRATDHFVVDDSEMWIAEQGEGSTFTLFSCHPKGSARQRYVVKGTLVRAERLVTRQGDNETPDGWVMSPAQAGAQPPATTTTTTTAPMCVLLCKE